MKSNLAFCVDKILRYEGGYSDHPSDPGGATNLGITRKRLAEYRGVVPYTNLSKEEVKNLKIPEARLIYKKYYWDVIWGDKLPFGIDLVIFDFAVNSGPSRAIKYAQAIVGVTVDGKMGPNTLKALQNCHPQSFIKALCDKRMGFLRSLKTFSVFGTGWTNRVTAVRKESLGIVSTRVVEETKPEVKTEPAAPEEKDSLLALIIRILLKLFARA